MRPATAVTRLDAGHGPLLPWATLPAVGPEVSGVGEYTTTSARGYYDTIPDVVAGISGSDATLRTEVRDHGLLGPVRLLREVGPGR